MAGHSLKQQSIAARRSRMSQFSPDALTTVAAHLGTQCGGLPRFAVVIGFEAAGLDFFFMALDTLIYDG